MPDSIFFLGEVARRLGQPPHVLDYVLRSRNWTVPIRGGRRIFSEDDVRRIRSELCRMGHAVAEVPEASATGLRQAGRAR